MKFEIQPIAFVRSPRVELADDDWGGVASVIELAPELPHESLVGLDAFSHVEVLYVFDQVNEDKIERSARHPRGNTERIDRIDLVRASVGSCASKRRSSRSSDSMQSTERQWSI
jgi:tRNA (Thr-GGU) A37 N-methylase